MGLESQKFKGDVAILPLRQHDSLFPGSNIFFYLYAYEFRNKSKALNQGKNIEYLSLFSSGEMFVLTPCFFHGVIYTKTVFRFYWYSDPIVSFFFCDNLK